jgi:two-component system chemotaxis response regulator CheB
LELGAIDFVAKPRIDVAGTLADYGEELIAKVKVAAGARVLPRPAKTVHVPEERHSTSAVVPILNLRTMLRTTDRIIAIGASTGGTEAIREVLSALPPDAPAIVISQHIPAAFSKPFADRMNRCSAMAVCEAQDGQQILPGHAYIALDEQVSIATALVIYAASATVRT